MGGGVNLSIPPIGMRNSKCALSISPGRGKFKLLPSRKQLLQPYLKKTLKNLVVTIRRAKATDTTDLLHCRWSFVQPFRSIVVPRTFRHRSLNVALSGAVIPCLHGYSWSKIFLQELPVTKAGSERNLSAC